MLGAMGFPKHYSTRHGEDEGRGHLSIGSMGFLKHKSIRQGEDEGRSHLFNAWCYGFPKTL